MKVLGTGATGFIGGNVARALLNRGYEVKALVRPGSSTLTIEDKEVEQAPGDIRDRESVATALDEIGKPCRESLRQVTELVGRSSSQ